MADGESIDVPIPGMKYYHGVPMPSNNFPRDVLDKIRCMTLREDDVLVLGYPKSGTTWLQYIVWLLMHQSDQTMAEGSDVWKQVPLLESRPPTASRPMYDVVEDMPSPRIFKSHLPAFFFKDELLKRRSRAVVIMRNPKDLQVSYHNFLKMRHPQAEISWNGWYKMFRDNTLAFGNCFDHFVQWWEFKDEPNFLFLKYETLKCNLRSEIRKIASFLELPCSDELVEEVARKSSFNTMKTDPKTNLKNVPYLAQTKDLEFLRKGEIGDWKNYFTEEQSKYFDDLDEQKFMPVGLEFVYSLENSDTA